MNDELAKEMAAKGLVRAQIMTLKGNKVWRWVKPDNPNIIGAAKQAVEKIVAEVIKVAEVIVPKPAMFYTQEFPGCCGGNLFVKINDDETEEIDWEAKYRGSYHERQHTMYESYVEQFEKEGNGRNADYYRYQLRHYDLEAFKKSETVVKPTHDGTAKKYGVIVSNDPFPYCSQSPGGVYYRKEREPVNRAKRDFFAAAAVVDFESLPKPSTRTYVIPYGPAYGDGKFTILVGAGGGTALASDMWSAIAKGKPTAQYNVYNSRTENTTPFVEGDLVLFIANNQQRNTDGLTTPKNIAAAGFTEVVRTGNSNHPNSSTLYLYERKITKEDVAAIKKGLVK